MCELRGKLLPGLRIQYIMQLMELVLPVLLSHEQVSLLATDQGFVQIQD